MKWQLLIIFTLILITIVSATATEFCEDILIPNQQCTMLTPSLSCGNYTYQIFNETNILVQTTNLTNVDSDIYSFTFNQSSGDYLVRLCDGSTREIYVEGQDTMSSLAITIFILAITGVLFALPKLMLRFSKNIFADLLLKRCCYILAIYLMVLNSAIMATIAESSGIAVTDEMFRYMWLFGTVGYLAIAFTVLKTLLDILDMWKLTKTNKRMGDDDE